MTANVPGAPDLTGNIGYQHDPKDQLTQETSALGGGFTSAFGYDPAGNPRCSRARHGATTRRTGDRTRGLPNDVQGNPTTALADGLGPAAAVRERYNVAEARSVRHASTRRVVFPARH